MKIPKWGGSRAEKAWGDFNRVQAPKQKPSAKKAWSKANKEAERDRPIGIKRAPSAKKAWTRAEKTWDKGRIMAPKNKQRKI